MFHALVHGCLFAKLGPATPGVIACAAGRALDFATTWVGLERGVAVEAKPGAAHILSWLGPHWGLVLYEFGVTTPAIFLGCHLVRYALRRHRRLPVAEGRHLLLYSVGFVSTAVALFNLRFLV